MARFTITPIAATPVFSPAAGTYTSTQSVTISDATSGATIYYTTNGTTPTISSTKYTAGITVSATETLEAIAVASGKANSAVASATYTIQAPTVASPAFSPAVGTYTSALSVTITDSTAGATIYYTTNATMPTTSSTKYTGAIPVSATETIEAIAVATGYTNSAAAFGIYTITPPAATPVFTPLAGTYTAAENVTITDSTPGATIYYTTNGTMPSASSAVYAGAITVSETETIEAIAVAPGYVNSTVASAAYTIQLPAGSRGETILYSFGILKSPATPNSTPVYDSKGNVYGTTLDEITSLGLLQRGSVYEVSHDPGGGWTESTLFTFQTPATGDTPNGVIFDATKANLYGTTQDGGTSSAGTVFELSPNGTGAWMETILWSFGATATDGSSPEGGLVFDAAGNLYGTTNGGGAHSYGTVFELSPNGAGGWTEKVLYSFAGSSIGDGSNPRAGLTFDTKGNLYGTTYSSGASGGYGTVFELTPASGGTWTEQVLHTFAIAGASDVGTPTGSLTLDTEGNVYGVGNSGGNHNSGAVYELSSTPSGWTEQLLYSFNGTSGSSDGVNPEGGVIFDAKGNLWGTAFHGGTHPPQGAIYELSPAGGSWTEQVQYNFNDSSSNDGFYPEASLALDSSGNFYGITTQGGAYTYGTLYEFTPAQAATPVFSPATGTYFSLQAVTITDATAGATIYYTTNGATPTIASTKYTGAITVSATETIEAIAVAAGYTNSAVASANYVIVPQAATPVFTPAAGTYTSARSVTVADATAGATIYYTTNGTTPTTSSAKYAGAIAVSATETIEAIAVATGYTNSVVASATYTIQSAAAATPVFSPTAGTYASAQSVTIIDSTSGASIYYTTNGTTPTPSSTKYTSAIAVSATETIEAIAVATGYTNSAVASAAYTIQPSPTGAFQFIAMTPCRIADTRNAASAFGGPELAAGVVRTFDVPQSGCGIPSTAVAYSLNVTVVPIASLGYLSIWPAGEAQPVVSTLNSGDGRVKANATITPAGTNGGVNVYASDATQLILDIDGYFVPAGTSTSGLEFFPLTPCRIADTRNATGPLGGPSLTGGVGRAFPVQSSVCGIPSTAKAYSLNITAVPHGGARLPYDVAYRTSAAGGLHAQLFHRLGHCQCGYCACRHWWRGFHLCLRHCRRNPGHQRLLRSSRRWRTIALHCSLMPGSRYSQWRRGFLRSAGRAGAWQHMRSSGDCAGLCLERDGRASSLVELSDAVGCWSDPAWRINAECQRRSDHLQHGHRAHCQRHHRRLRHRLHQPAA